MKWISSVNRHSVLPILLGISLTTFGLSVALVLFNMLEKDDDDDDDRKKHDRVAKRESKRKEVCVKLRIPHKYVPAVIGKGGTVITNIQELTNTRIKMDEEIPFDSERICNIWSDDMKNITSARSMIQYIVENQPVIETFELFLPFGASKEVFRRPAEFVQQIQKTYGVKVTVENVGLKQRVTIKGTVDQIASAVIEIEDRVQKNFEAQCRLEMYLSSGRMPGDSDDEDTINGPDSDINDYLVPYDVCRGIIEKDRCAMEEIEKSSGAKIIGYEAIANYKDTRHRNIVIKGTDEQVKLAASLIKSKTKHLILNPALQNGSMEVFVSAMKSPNLFWIQVINRANVELQHLVYEMTEYYNNEENCKLHILKTIIKGQTVAVRHKYDNKWYRAEVMSVLNSPMYQVFLVDYGDVKIVHEDDMLELCTNMLSLRQQAVECSLTNVKPPGDKWTSKACEKFAEFVHLGKWEPLVATVKGYKESVVADEEPHRKGSVIPCIDLYDKAGNRNIGDNLVQMGLAEIEEGIALTLLCAVCGVLGGRRYIAIPVDGIDGIDVIEVNPLTPSLSRVARQTEAYVPVAVSSASHQDDSEIQRSERSAARVLDYVDFGGHTGSNGAFSWYADYPAHRL
ncbi:tudor and KH domain containing protein papi [Temnothorax americanus]|uniref:tudor and KH domain containing protein papi n=1 Tax=Temnothorax americanus TaxID=1964332 RepID=UPI004067D8B9